MFPAERLKRTMVRTAVVVLVAFLNAGCPAPPSPNARSEPPSKEVDVSEKDHLPHDAGPRPANPICPPGMVGSCR
jgi:hypothetical protein